ncbi:MAG TPA: cytochrome c peroxidase [Fimbriimonas sp.]|nr:cytochrome c peroxidase [Fimbriimonas sp.]
MILVKALFGIVSVSALAVGISRPADPAALGTPGPVPFPKNNPYSAAKAELGRKLFQEGAMSKTGLTPCTWCHEVDRGFHDGRTISIGDPRTALNRHTPSLLNVGYQKALFWDGRTSSLEEQALMPIAHPDEMDMDLKVLPGVLRAAGYEEDFKAAFGTSAITTERVAMALATFQRTLTANDTPFDRYIAGDKTAMSEAAIRGLELFKGKANCITCHGGPHFTNALVDGKEAYANTGLYQSPVLDPDSGRFGVIKNPKASDAMYKNAFRIPTLRGVGRTAPYMHNGQLANLEEVVEFYNRGGDEGLVPKLGLTDAEKKDLVAFLRTGLTSRRTQ